MPRYLTVDSCQGSPSGVGALRCFALRFLSFETLPKRPARTIRPQHECLPHFPSRRASAFIPRQMVVVVALAKDSLEAARQPAPSRRTQAYALRGSGGMSAAGRAADRIDAEERHDLACAKGVRVSSFGTPPAADNKAVVVLVNENTTDVTPTASINPAAALVDRADSVPDEHKRDRLQGAKRSHSSGFGEHLQRGKCRFALITRRAGASNHSVSSPAGCQKTIHRWEEVCRQH